MDQNDKLKRAMSDVAVIKETMQESRMQTKKLILLFFLYGLGTLVFYGAFTILEVIFEGFDARLQSVVLLYFTQYFYLVLMIFFLVWRREVVKKESSSTLQLYDTWGFSLFLIPSIFLIFHVFSKIAGHSLGVDSASSMQVLFWVAEQLSFFYGIAMMGFYLKSTGWKIVSAVCTLLYFSSFYVLKFDDRLLSSATNIFKLVSFALQSTWGYVQRGWIILCGIISLIMALYFWPENKKI